MSALGTILQQARERQALTRAEIGRRVGSSPSRITAYEEGHEIPDARTWARYCGTLRALRAHDAAWREARRTVTASSNARLVNVGKALLDALNTAPSGGHPADADVRMANPASVEPALAEPPHTNESTMSPDPAPESFATAFQRARMTLKLTAAEFAALLGVTLSSIRSWECGRYRPRADRWPAVISAVPELARFAPATTDAPLTAPKVAPPPPDLRPAAFARALRAARQAASAGQRDFAEKFGVTQSTISVWEHGHRLPDAKYWPAILRVLPEFAIYAPTPTAPTAPTPTAPTPTAPTPTAPTPTAPTPTLSPGKLAEIGANYAEALRARHVAKLRFDAAQEALTKAHDEQDAAQAAWTAAEEALQTAAAALNEAALA